MKKTVFKLVTALVVITAFCISAAGCFGAPQETSAPKDPATADYIGFGFYIQPTDGNLSITVNTDYAIGNFRYYFDESNSPVPSDALKEITLIFYKEAENENPSEAPSEIPSEVPSENPSEVPSANPSENPSETPSENPDENPETVINGEIFETAIININDKITVNYTDGAENPLDEADAKYICKLDEKSGYITVRAAEMYTGDSLKISAKLKDGRETKNDGYNECKLNVTAQVMTLMDVLFLGIGLYLLYLGIRGKGKFYENEFVKEGMEKKHKLTIRLSCLLAAALTIASGLIAAFDGYGKYAILKQILFYAAIAVFIIAMIVTGTMIDKKARKEAQQRQQEGRSVKTNNAAFVFDEDEPTVDDIKNNRKD